ncbi:hypothetical protein [Streptomyces rugosispiralis]|uniref:Transposase n=1 Tax=Streptomyces rugosispiralis TaxID=2967341 RepID=A0ABT1VCQ1_9ACTN|nr:hypothetical protein [Streptomyces rugosispiralis]MCQ8195052.1 hypothetical protein [Streptomyces rugosispiralis]
MNEVMLCREELLFLATPEVAVVSAEEDGEVIRIGIRCRAAGARCPGCGAWPRRQMTSTPEWSFNQFATRLHGSAGRWIDGATAGSS